MGPCKNDYDEELKWKIKIEFITYNLQLQQKLSKENDKILKKDTKCI